LRRSVGTVRLERPVSARAGACRHLTFETAAASPTARRREREKRVSEIRIVASFPEVATSEETF